MEAQYAIWASQMRRQPLIFVNGFLRTAQMMLESEVTYLVYILTNITVI